jgi:hypothetical protein
MLTAVFLRVGAGFGYFFIAKAESESECPNRQPKMLLKTRYINFIAKPLYFLQFC